MKKLLLLTAAALVASAFGASAGETTTLALNGRHNDTFTITDNGYVFAQTHNRGGFQTFGAGMAASTPVIWYGVMVTDFGKNGNLQACYDFEYPFHTGGHWYAYGTFDGKNIIPMGHGTYRVEPNVVKP